MTGQNRDQGPNDAAQQRRRDQLRREEEAARLREQEEAVNALLLLRAGFGEFGLWGNVPGNVPGTVPLEWQRNWQSVPGARPVSFGPVAGGGSNQQTTITTTTMSNVPSGITRGTTSHGRPAVSTARLDTLAAVAASSQHLPLAQEGRRPLQDTTNGGESLLRFHHMLLSNGS